MAHTPAFAPRFAAPPHPPLWSGEGIGAEVPVATPFGPMQAGRLQPGDTLLGPAGASHRLEEVRRLALPATAHRRLGLAAPVAIAPGALGFGQPSHPLVLGPAHCLRLDGAWLPAGLIADGTAIVPLEHGAPLMLLRCAGGAPFLAAGTPVGSIGTPPSDGPACIPALLRLSAAAPAPLGFVDHADRFGVTGWALDPAAPDRVVPVEAEAAGTLLARGLADRPRPDLVQGGASRLGRHGYRLRFARPLPPGRPWLVTVRRAGGGPALPGSPLLIDAATPDPARFDIALAGLPADAAPFLAGLIDRVLQARQA